MIQITHNAGFFSCCSVRLSSIVDYINSHKSLPDVVDSSSQFEWYKKHDSGDITYEYFEDYNNVHDISYDGDIEYHWSYQFTEYSKLNYEKLCPIVRKYFSPSLQIKNMIKFFEDKYNFDYNNTCVLFYRGNDKNRETSLCSYDEYIIKADAILKNNPNIQFLIQSDETEFIETFTQRYPNNSFYFKDEIRHVNKCDDIVDKIMPEKNYLFSKYFLSIIIIMSRCKFIVCGSGNCPIWIMLYRENFNNVIQNLNGKWI